MSLAQSAGAVEYTSAEGYPQTQRMSWYDIKQSDGEVPVIPGFGGMRNSPSFAIVPRSLWPRMVAPDRALSMG